MSHFWDWTLNPTPPTPQTCLVTIQSVLPAMAKDWTVDPTPPSTQAGLLAIESIPTSPGMGLNSGPHTSQHSGWPTDQDHRINPYQPWHGIELWTPRLPALRLAFLPSYQSLPALAWDWTVDPTPPSTQAGLHTIVSIPNSPGMGLNSGPCISQHSGWHFNH